MLEKIKRAKIKFILLISSPFVPFFRKSLSLNTRPLRHNPDYFKNNLFSVVRLHLAYEIVRLRKRSIQYRASLSTLNRS